MNTIDRRGGPALPILAALAFTFALSVGWSLAFSAEGPKEVRGFGEMKTAPSVEMNLLKGGTRAVKSFGKKSLGAIGDTVGNRVTFAFIATKDAKGEVTGQMFFTDHALNLSISSDIVALVPHPKDRSPVGVTARGLEYPVKIVSSKTSVVVNGKPKPTGWKAVNSPVFDGDRDVVCLELFDATGKKIYQWAGFVSVGDVKTE